MHIVRFRDSVGAVHYGVQTPDDAHAAFRIEGDILANYTVTKQKVALAKLLAPLEPRLILCIGLNYKKHAEETGAKIPDHPVLFMKGPACVQHPGDPIEIPQHLKSTQVDFECELAVVIGRRCKNATPDNALDFVLGYTVANDVSARDWQKTWGGSQWCRGKTFDTFCPLGPALVTTDELPDPQALTIQTRVNGQLMQDSQTSDMIFNVRTIIAFLSGSTTLVPGTVILTGTPAGVGAGRKPPVYLQPGDRVACRIDGIGEITNPVIHEPQS